MTTQEEIRDGIENIICDCCDDVAIFLEAGQTLIEAREYCRKEGVCAYCTDLREAIQRYEHSQGVVMKVERELPKVETFCQLAQVECIPKLTVQQVMLETGYSAWEPLIGDG